MTRLALILTVSFLSFGCQKRPDPLKAKAPPREQAWQAYEVIPIHIASRKDKPGNFDQLRSGMTLGELVGTLGRGRLAGGKYYSGCGIINWICEDGRQLSVWPITYERDEVIRVDGGSGGVGSMCMTQTGREGALEILRK